MSKTHYKKLQNPDYIGAYSLDEGKDMTVTILSVSREFVTGDKGKKDECIVAKLKGQKPMILNATNCKTISQMYGPYIEDWSGKSITLFASTTSLKGETVECLRIRLTTPINLDDLKELFELKKGVLTDQETVRAKQIIETNETNSFQKLYNKLKSL